VAFGDEDVLGLDIAVYDPMPMGVVQRLGALAGNPNRVFDR
jgi:hypothetical protein